LNGHLTIGNFLSRISGHDFSNPRGASCLNLIGVRMGPHFSQMNCAPSLSRKVRAFSVGKRYWLQIHTNAQDSSIHGTDIPLRCSCSGRHAACSAMANRSQHGCLVATISNRSNPSSIAARALRCLPGRDCRGKPFPPNSSPARKAQYSYLCCEPNGVDRDREMKRWK
jgi:hypothetical protein